MLRSITNAVQNVMSLEEPGIYGIWDTFMAKLSILPKGRPTDHVLAWVSQSPG